MALKHWPSRDCLLLFARESHREEPVVRFLAYLVEGTVSTEARGAPTVGEGGCAQLRAGRTGDSCYHRCPWPQCHQPFGSSLLRGSGAIGKCEQPPASREYRLLPASHRPPLAGQAEPGGPREVGFQIGRAHV